MLPYAIAQSLSNRCSNGLQNVVPFLLESTPIKRGATHKKSANFQAHVGVSGRLVTGQNPASARGVGEQMVKLILSATKRLCR